MAFIKGQSGNVHGRPLGSTNKPKVLVTLEEWFEDSIEYIKDGPYTNPLVIMMDIACNHNNTHGLRLKAAEAVAKYIVPALPQQMDLTVSTYSNDQLTNDEIMERLNQINHLLLEQKVVDTQ